MNNKLNDLLALVMPILTLVVTVFAENIDPVIRYTLLGAMLVFIVAYFVYIHFQRNNNLSNTKVIFKSKKYTKYLKHLVKTNAKVLDKAYNRTELAETKRKIDVLSKKIRRSYHNKDRENFEKYLDQKRKLLDSYYDKSREYVDSDVLKAMAKATSKPIQNADYLQSKQIFDKIYDTIKSMERILLQLEQHALRIKLGKYVVKYSTDIEKTIHAYVDYLGWTYILLGKNSKGFEAIQNGLHLIDYKINSNKAGHDKYVELKEKGEPIPAVVKKQHEEYCEYTLQKARALRHIGTTYYTYRSYKDNFIKENYNKEELNKKSKWNFKNTLNPYIKCKMAEGLALMDEPSVIEYFSETPKRQETYSKMVSGLKYNDLLYDYYVALYRRDHTIETYVGINNKLNELIEEIDRSPFSDDHRLIKILTLKNQLNHKIYNQQDEAGVKYESRDTLSNLLAKDLKTIESVLNKNIYFDEAMEVYVCQKVRKLYSDIDEIFKAH